MLAILNYHNIAPVPPGMLMPRLYVSSERFERQLWWLRRIGLIGVTLTEGIRRLRDGVGSKCVAITFDDGYQDNLTNAAPILRQYGCAATCFIVSERLGSYNTWDAERLGGRKPLMSAAEIGSWLEHGFEIGSHTCTHRDLTTLSGDELLLELVDSRHSLHRLTGSPIPAFCYPFGAYTAQTLEYVGRAGYQLAVSVRRGRAHRRDNLLTLPRLSVNGRKGLVKFMLKAATPYTDVGRLWGST